MQTQIITREEVINLVNQMPLEKLISWYEYGLSIQSQPVRAAPPTAADEDETDLQHEFAAWEAASDEDWLTLEKTLAEVADGTR